MKKIINNLTKNAVYGAFVICSICMAIIGGSTVYKQYSSFKSIEEWCFGIIMVIVLLFCCIGIGVITLSIINDIFKKEKE